jgi:hypothetical protein
MNKNAYDILCERVKKWKQFNVQGGIVQYRTSTPWNAGQLSEMSIMKTMEKYEIMLTESFNMKWMYNLHLLGLQLWKIGM